MWHGHRTTDQFGIYVHLESTNQYVSAALKVWRLTSFAMNIDSLNVCFRIRFTRLRSMTPVIGSSHRLRRRGSRFHRRSLYVFKLNPCPRTDPPLNNKRYISFLRNGLIDKARANYLRKLLKDVKGKYFSKNFQWNQPYFQAIRKY